MSQQRNLGIAVLVAAISCTSAAAETRIVLIGGAKSEGPAQHDYPNGIRMLESMLRASPDAQAVPHVVVEAHPDGWPPGPAALAGAAAVVLYFDGLEKHPLLDVARRSYFEAALQRGTGVVVLHQASTVPADDTELGLQRWLGAMRPGMFDRATELVQLTPAPHEVTRGLAKFTYRDEFYPTLRFSGARKALSPLLRAPLHPDFREGRFLVLGKPTVSTVAWAFERPGGGRSFGYTGAHYLAAFDEPGVRKLLLNAMFWTARLEVPPAGVRDALPADAAGTIARRQREAALQPRRLDAAVVTRASQNEVIEFPWGRLTWYVSGKLGNSDTLTVGRAVIRPGEQNPRHHHPNCDEVLRVVQGRILHSMGDRTVEMSAGDTVSIPTGVIHNARNLGNEDAVLDISFSSADRQVVGE